MRFDDRFETVMRQPTSPDSAAAQWTQLVDILAQDDTRLGADARAAARERLHALRGDVPVERRRAAAVAIASRCRSEALVALFAEDELRVGAPILLGANVAPEEWVALLPKLSPPARSLLRERRDLAPEVRRALAAFGEQDFVIGDARDAAERPVASPETPQAIPISALVERIAQWRQDRPIAPRLSAQDPAPETGPVRFLTDASGAIVWQRGGLAEALIGTTLAELAPPGGYGVDGQTTGAFAKRATIGQGRLVLPDGDWTLDARPKFAGDSGRFAGYIGILRRGMGLQEPHLGLPHDAARQVVHELGTPLNAIRGFSEMIAGEMLGPVVDAHRERARAIVSDARRLAVVVDEIDAAARLDGAGQLLAHHSEGVTLATLFARIGEDIEEVRHARGATVSIANTGNNAPLMASEAELERLVRRFVLTLAGIADRGAHFSVVCETGRGIARLTIALPSALHGKTDALLASTLSADDLNPDAPPLGLGYTLRLIAAMARKAGGRLEISDSSCALIIPAHTDSGTAVIESL